MSKIVTVFVPPDLGQWFESYREARELQPGRAMSELTDLVEGLRAPVGRGYDAELDETTYTDVSSAHDWTGRLYPISFENILFSSSLVETVQRVRGWDVDTVFAWIILAAMRHYESDDAGDVCPPAAKAPRPVR